jgi:TRAP-type C4-dicarboxylate transport system permease small subunit
VKVFSKSVFYIMNILKIIGMICLALVMLIISVGVISRLLGKPLLGVIELAEIIHFVVILFAFGYTQSEKEHIAIGLMVERFSPKVQLIFDNIAHVLTVCVCIVISYIFFLISMEETKTSLLLDFPFMVLKIIVTIGFFVWGLVALSQISFKTPPSEKEVSPDV